MIASSKYEMIRPIASGGMATVYLGRIIGRGGFQRLVAIKKMHPHLAQNVDFVSMFLDEARLAASIHHPNVVGTLDIDESSDGLGLVMEFIEGTSLFKLYAAARKTDTRVPLPIVLRIMLDSLAGLQAAHDLVNADGFMLNLVHRDISPQNILVGLDGISRITDFGVARAEERLIETSDGSMKGKLAYMCPEQLRGEALDRRADVYAAGVCFWELLAGRRLFSAESGAATVSKVLKGATEAPSVYTPGIPSAIDVVVMTSLLAGNARYPSANAFAEAIEQAAQQSGVPIASARQVGEHVREIAPPVPLSASGSIAIPTAPPSVTGPNMPTPRGSSNLTGPHAPLQHGQMEVPAYAAHPPGMPLGPDAGGTGSGSMPGMGSGVTHGLPSLTAMNPMLQPGAPHARPAGPTTAQGIVGGVAFALSLCLIGGGYFLYQSQSKKPDPPTIATTAETPPPTAAQNPNPPPTQSADAVNTPPPPTGTVTPPAPSDSALAKRPPAPAGRPSPPSHPAPPPAPAPTPSAKPNGKFHPLDP